MTATLTAESVEAPSWIDMVKVGLTPEQQPLSFPTPGAFAKALDRTTVQTPALDAIDDVLVQVAAGEAERVMFNLPPQEGKSERISRRFVLWMLIQNPNLRIAIVSSSLALARRFGGLIRDDLRNNPQLGLTLSESTKAKHEFELLGYRGGVVCVGVEGSLTGRPVDLLIIDDPYKDAGQADSKAWQETVRNFWTEVALPRLSPGAPVVLVQTRWRQDDLAGWLSKEGDDWRVMNIPARADHDPDKGETDVLGREPGEFLISARGRTEHDWLKKIREVGSRAWNALYQGRPSPAAGTILQRDWWREYTQPQWLEHSNGVRAPYGFDEVIQSWDMTFKKTQGTDMVVGQVWGRRGADAYLLAQVRRRMDFPDTRKAVKALSGQWPSAVRKLIEAKANGPAVIASLEHVIYGMIPVEPDGGKEERTAAVAPLVEAGNVYLPSPLIDGCAWVADFIEECAGFPNAAHDDVVDCMSQALNRLILQPLADGTIYTSDDLDDELASYGTYVP